MPLIFKQSVRTQQGRSEVRIIDDNPDARTPDLHRGEILGGVKLKQGDSGTSSEGLPAQSFGSYFKLRFVDNESRDFQRIFSQIGDETRYRVEFDIAGFGIWRGYVKRQLQTRRIGKRNREDVLSVACYDRMAALDDISRFQDAFNKDVLTFLEDALALANPDVPIYFYWDIAGNSINESDDIEAGPDRMYPYEEISHRLAPWSDEPDGLEGSTVRAQLNQLCQKVHAFCFYDIRRSAWVFTDIATMGEEREAGGAYRYNGNSWNAVDLERSAANIDSGVNLRSEGDDILKQLPATNKVCFEITNLLTDPKQEQYDAEGTDTLYWYDHPNASVQKKDDGDRGDTYSEVEHEPGDNLTRFQFLNISLRDITHVRIRGEHEQPGSAANIFEYNVIVEYGDGTQTTYDDPTNSRGGTLEDLPLFVSLDTSKDVIHSFNFNVACNRLTGGADTYQLEIAFVTEVTVTRPGGTTGTEYRVVDQICYEDEGVPGRTYEGETHSLVIEESNGSLATSEGFFSRRYENVFYLPRWKGQNLIALQTEETEKLKVDVEPELIPFGTKVTFTKPGDGRKSNFVPLDGRTLHFGTDEYDSATSLNEMQVPNSVIDALTQYEEGL